MLTWSQTDGLKVAFGPDARAEENRTPLTYGPSVCCVVGPSIAAYRRSYKSASAWVAWCAQNEAPPGAWVQQRDIRLTQGAPPPVPYPSADGTPVVLPGTTVNLCDSGPVPIAVRYPPTASQDETLADVQFFVAYPAGTGARDVRLWKPLRTGRFWLCAAP